MKSEQFSITAIVEEDEFANYHLVLIENDGNFTRLAQSHSPVKLCEFAEKIGLQVIHVGEKNESNNQHNSK